ncbi:phosphonate metabolism transcriptional regulator PhnF, partial [Acidisoma sp. C75]
MRQARVILWQRIAETLTAEIGSGAFPPGARLPTETALAERFRVNRHTVRQAIGALADAGLVQVQHGRGTFVQPAPIIQYPLGARTRFSDIISRQSRTADGEVLSSQEIPAEQAVAEALDLAPGEPVLVLEILRRADGVPISLKTAHFPARRFPGLEACFRETHSLTEALRRFGITDYARRSTRIWTRMPSLEEARLLQQQPA